MREILVRRPVAAVAVLALAAGLGACSADDPSADRGSPAATSATSSATPSAAPATPSDPSGGAPTSGPSGSASPSQAPGDSILTMTPPDPVSLPALAQATHVGGGLRVGAVRERTATYTSYDVSYRSDDLRISGVLNVPAGPGPFPAVVLAHGYIAPEYYVRGQGMTRERGYLADHGYVALHVDYRNHAESGQDPRSEQDVDLGYASDVINAVAALRKTTDVPVDDERVAVMGRSMGGAVVYNALVARPGLVQAAVAWSSNSTLEAQVFRRFRDPQDPAARVHGLPSQNPAFWAGVSSRTYLDQITTPVLVVQGGSDDTCPPRWGRATFRALRAAGVDARLAWYPNEEHAFGPEFEAAMARSVRFLAAHGV